MKDVLVLGAGKIGALISGLLAESGDYRVQLADSNPGTAAEVANAHGLEMLTAFDLDAMDEDALTAHVRAHKTEAVVSSLPYFCNVGVARCRRHSGCSRAGGRIRQGIRSAMRAGTRLYQHCSERTDSAFRFDSVGKTPRRRAAAEPEQRTEVFANLVDGRGDQRIRQPLQGYRRWQ
jgi:hypothetical protein